MVDGAVEALEVLDDDVGGDVAGDVDRVAAEAADDAVGDAVGRRLDVERVVALEAVDLDHLHVAVADVDARAEDAGGGDDDLVGELGAEHDDLVEAGAAVERDRGVDVVGDVVVAGAAADIQRPRGRGAEHRLREPVGAEHDRAVGHLGEREGAHGEAVVAVVALQAQLGLVGVDDELVVARAALGDQRRVRTGAQPALGRGDQDRKDVGRREPAVGDVALGPEDLPDLERVVVGAAVEGDDRRGVVGEERVVAALAVDAQAAVEASVVVDPLDERALLVAGDRVAVAVEVVAGGVHDVVVPSGVLADAVDRHDVGVVQPPGGAGLAAEPGQVGRLAEQLQGDVAIERLLVRLVDDPHAPPADLAHDPEVAPGLGQERDVLRLNPSVRLPGRDQRPQPGIPDEFQPDQDRVGRPVELPGLLAAPDAAIQVLGDLGQLGLGQLAHGEGEQPLRARASDRAHSLPLVPDPVPGIRSERMEFRMPPIIFVSIRKCATP